jgi:hypothetical protein
MQQLKVDTVFWLRISQVARTIHGGSPLRDEMDLVLVDEASNPALAELSFSYKRRETFDHLPRR